MNGKTIYLDHAATSFPKPREVEDAVLTCMRKSGGNPGRGSHRPALLAAEEVYRCRELAASLFGTAPERVVFTLNATHALNTAIKGILSHGDHVLCSDMEHNAVLRPLYRLFSDGIITFDTFESHPLIREGRDGKILASIAEKLQPHTRLVVCTQASNICSAHLPIAKIGAFCRRRGLILLVDASQSAGHMDIDLERDMIDVLCVPGHKGLLGPQGTGMLLLGSRFGRYFEVDTLTEGGNGMDSLSPTMTGDVPERLEAGTVATPAIAGLRAGITHMLSIGPGIIGAREAALTRNLCDGLLALPRVRVYAPHHSGSVVLFSVEGLTSEEIGRRFDADGICVRAGFHCSALGHRTLGTAENGGVRVSVGYSTRERDIDALLRAVGRL